MENSIISKSSSVQSKKKKRLSDSNVPSPKSSSNVYRALSCDSRTERRANQILDCQRILSRVRERILGFDDFHNSGFNKQLAASDSTITEKGPASEGITRISTMRKSPTHNGNRVVKVSTTRRSDFTPTGIINISTTKKINGSDEHIIAVTATGISNPQIDNSDNALTESDSVLIESTKANCQAHPELTYKSSSFVETEISMHPMRSCTAFPVGVQSPRGIATPRSTRSPKNRSPISLRSSKDAKSPISTGSPASLRSPARSMEISPDNERHTRQKSSNLKVRSTEKKEREGRLRTKKSPITNKNSRISRRQCSPDTDDYLTPTGSPPRMLRSRSAPIRNLSPYKSDRSHQKLSRPQSSGNQKQTKVPKIARRKTKESSTQKGLPTTLLRKSPTREDTGRLSRKASLTSRVSKLSRLEALATPKRCASNAGLISDVTAKRIASKREELQEERRHAAEMLQQIYQDANREQEEKTDKPLGLSHNNRVAIRSYVKSQQFAEENQSENKTEKPKQKVSTQRPRSANVKTRNLSKKMSSRRFANFSNLFKRAPECKENHNTNVPAKSLEKKRTPQNQNETSSKFKSKTNDQRSKTSKKTPLNPSRLNNVPKTYQTHSNKRKFYVLSDSVESVEKETENKEKKGNIKGLNVSIKKSRLAGYRSDNTPKKKLLCGREYRRSSQILAKSSSILSRFSPISEGSSKGESRSRSRTPVQKSNMLNNSEEGKKSRAWVEKDDMAKSNSRLNNRGYSARPSRNTSTQRLHDSLYQRTSRIASVLDRTPIRRCARPLPPIYDELAPLKDYLTPEEICKIALRINAKDSRDFSSSQRLSRALEERLQKLEAARRRFQSHALWAQKSYSRLNHKNSMIYKNKKRINPLSLSPSVIPIKKATSPHLIPESELSTVTPPENKTKENKSGKKKNPVVTPDSPTNGKTTVKKIKFAPVKTKQNAGRRSRNEEACKPLIIPALTEESKRRKCLVSKMIMNRASSATATDSAVNKTASVVSTVGRKSTATQPEDLVIEVARIPENEKPPDRSDKVDQATYVSSEHKYMKRSWALKEICQDCAHHNKEMESKPLPIKDEKILYESKSQRLKSLRDPKKVCCDFEKSLEENCKMTYGYSKKQFNVKTTVTTRYTKGISRDLAKPIRYEIPNTEKTIWYDKEMLEKAMAEEEEPLEEVEVEDEQDLEQKVSEGLSLDSAPLSRVPIIPDSVSDFMNFLDYDAPAMQKIASHHSVPETDWRLITALAKKREIDEDRERMADAFQKMWLKEKELNKEIASEQKDEYERYLREKRAEERLWHEQNRLRHVLAQQQRREQVLSAIKNKRDKAFNSLTKQFGERADAIIEKAIEEDARIQLATDKRSQLDLLEAYRLHADRQAKDRRHEDAGRRRKDALKNVSKRLAINRALNEWTSSLLRQEVLVEEATRRAHSLARVARVDERSQRLKRAREQRLQAARELAAFTQRLRDAIRDTRH